MKALTCGSNVQLLSRQIDEFHPDIAVTAHEEDAATLSKIHKGVEFFWGREGLIKAAEAECGLLLNALVGMRGMEPTYRGHQEWEKYSSCQQRNPGWRAARS